MGTALVVTIMSGRAASQVREGVAPAAAQLEGMRWAFGVSAVLCVVVLALVAMLPSRIADPSDHAEEAVTASDGADDVDDTDDFDDLDEDKQVACPV